ncbi:MAG: clostripain-related cysteine peptidase [Marinifilaceae bacterium]
MKRMCNRVIVALVAMMCVLTACDDEESKRETSDRVLLFYMLVPSNLVSEFENNIRAIKTGYKGEGDILILKDSPNDIPRLYHLVQKSEGGKNVWAESEVRNYSQFEGKTHLPEIMGALIDDACSTFPAQSYGLVLSAHGTGWLPPSESNRASTLSFGPELASQMSVEDMAKAIPEGVFDYIAFDACFMASAEVAYALRDKARWYFASTTEIAGDGFPYRTMINEMLSMSTLEEYKQVCDLYYATYGTYLGGTLSLIDLSEMENLRLAFTKYVNEELELLPSKVLHFAENRTGSIFSSYAYKFYDMMNFVELSAGEERYNKFKKTFDRAVVYVRSSQKFFNQVPLENNSGLSIYYPSQEEKNYNFKKYQYDYYKTLDWAVDLDWERFNQ